MKARNVLTSVCFLRHYAFEPSNTEAGFAGRFNNFVAQAAMNEQYGIRATYMPQYDVLILPNYQEKLLSEREKNQAEIGFWFEVVQPLVEDAGIPWRGRPGMPWDHYVDPGFLMAYTEDEKKRLIDTAMEKFRSIFGCYPPSVGSWMLDSFSMQYMSEKYAPDAFIICREQWGMDGYTLWGGPYYGGYYPSKNNMQTPATREENRIKTPLFRMFINDPIYCYYEHEHSEERYMRFNRHKNGLFTQEPAWVCGQNPEWVRWMYDNLFVENNGSFSFIELGQESCFGWKGRSEIGMELQCKHVKEHPEYALTNMTVGEMGRYFKETFKDTPPMAMGALTDWAGLSHQSVWYNSKFYRVNLWNDGENLLIRDIHAFFDGYRDRYLDTPCTTHNAIYDNPPVVDGVRMTSEDGETKGGMYFGKGKMLSRRDCGDFYEVTAEVGGNALSIKLYPERIEITGDTDFALDFLRAENEFETGYDETHVFYAYGGISYALTLDAGVFDGKALQSVARRIVMRIEQK